MHRRVFGRVVATLLVTLGVVVPVPAPATAAAEPDPVVNRAVFNDPLGAPAEQHAVFSQLARLIDRVPTGEQLRMSFPDWSYPDVPDTAEQPDLVDRLLAAHQRGVHVQIVVDHRVTGQQPYARLSPALGHDDRADSFIVDCGAQRGCVATRLTEGASGRTYAGNNNRFLLASKIVLNNGTTLSQVVFQGSGDLSQAAVKSYADGVTWADPVTYEAFRRYFDDLRDMRRTRTGDPNYWRVSPAGGDYRAHFFPRREPAGGKLTDPTTDPVASILDNVKACTYDDNGVRRQTDIRIAMSVITRVEVARRLAALVKAGCWVDVLYTVASPQVLAAFGRDIQLTRCTIAGGPDPQVPGSQLQIGLQSKFLLLDGAYVDDIDPRVFTGSHAYTVASMRQSDETLVRIMGRGMHDDYLRRFWQVRHTCAAHGGVVQ